MPDLKPEDVTLSDEPIAHDFASTGKSEVIQTIITQIYRTFLANGWMSLPEGKKNGAA